MNHCPGPGIWITKPHLIFHLHLIFTELATPRHVILEYLQLPGEDLPDEVAGRRGAARRRPEGPRRRLPPRGPEEDEAAHDGDLGKISKFCKCLQNFANFGRLVLGCIKTKFCKKICVWQHFSSSTRFAYFCTAAISKFSQKIGLKIQQIFANAANAAS